MFNNPPFQICSTSIFFNYNIIPGWRTLRFHHYLHQTTTTAETTTIKILKPHFLYELCPFSFLPSQPFPGHSLVPEQTQLASDRDARLWRNFHDVESSDQTVFALLWSVFYLEHSHLKVNSVHLHFGMTFFVSFGSPLTFSFIVAFSLNVKTHLLLLSLNCTSILVFYFLSIYFVHQFTNLIFKSNTNNIF